ERAARLRAIGGEARAHFALYGSMSDVLGDVRVEARDLKPGGHGPVALAAALSLEDDETAIDAGVDLAGSPLLTARGTAGVGGRGLLGKIRAHAALDPELDVALDIPKRPVASLSALRAALASLPGVLEGHVAISGTAQMPLAKGRISATGIETLDG